MLPIVIFVALQVGALQAGVRAPVMQDTARAITQYKLEQWTDANGLPQNSIWAVAQTPDQFLWIATEQGLIRFDGDRFEVFNPTNTPAFRRSQLLALAVGPDGTLWIGTAGGGLVSYSSGRFTHYDPPGEGASDYVQSVAVDSAGGVWAGTTRGLLHLDRSGRMAVFDRQHGLPHDDVSTVATDGAGVVWAGTKGGLVRIGDAGPEVVAGNGALHNEQVRVITPARDGGLWIGTNGGGVYSFDGERFRLLDRRLSEQTVYAIAEEETGTLWIGTNGHGLHRWAGGRLETLAETNGGSDLVWALLHNAEGSLWVGTNGRGLIHLRETAMVPLGAREGLSGDVTLAVLETRSGDRWIGTAGAGLNRISPNGTITHFNSTNGLAARLIIALAELPNGDVLIGAQNGSLTRYHDGRMTDVSAAHGLTGSVTAILPESDGSYWVATNGGGLSHYAGGRRTTLRAADGLLSDFVLTLHRAPDGTIWVGTRDGVSRIVNRQVVPIEEQSKVHRIAHVAFYDAADGAVWAATQGQGIARIANGKVSYIGASAGLCDDIVHAMADDSAGYLWFSSNRGISRTLVSDVQAYFEGQQNSVRCNRYDVADGMRSREVNGGFTPAIAKLRSGRLMFPTMAGVITFDPRTIQAAPAASPVMLQNAVLGHDTVRLDTLREVRLIDGDRNLAIQFTSPTYLGERSVRYRFRLDGFDKQWIDPGSQKAAYYTNLPPGEYTFRVAAANAEGVWLETPTSLRVVVPPRFYETWWFYALCLLSVTVLAFALHRLRLAALQRNAAHLAMLVHERTQAEERYRDLLENASDVVIICDADGRIGSWNAEAERVTGYSKAEAVGTPLTQLLPEIGSIRDLTRRDIDFANKCGRPASIEITTREIIENGAIVGYQVFGRDVYEWRRMQAQLEQAQKMEAIGRLAGGIAHDFNNLLTVIRGNSELITNAQPEVREIIKAADSAASLTQQLLAFSRRQVQQTRALDLNLKIMTARSFVERLIGADVEVVTALDENLPRVRGDRGQIDQIIINLIVNSRDAMPDGGKIFISTRPYTIRPGRESEEWETEPGAYVELAIRDTGTGMDSATRSRIFEPFFTTKGPGRGTGLGLATVYGVVKQTGGHITVESSPGKGTTVRVYLPVASGELPDSGHAAETVARPVPPANGARILLVEDEDAVRTLTRKVLVRHGYTVTTAAGGPEALELLEQHGDVDLLLTDIVMPVMNGRELASQVHSRYPQIRILYMSGYTEDEVIRRGILPEGEQYLGKPFTPAGLVEAVAAALDARGSVPHK